MFKLKSVTSFIRFGARGVVVRVMVNLFIGVERTTAIKSKVFI